MNGGCGAMIGEPPPERPWWANVVRGIIEILAMIALPLIGLALGAASITGGAVIIVILMIAWRD